MQIWHYWHSNLGANLVETDTPPPYQGNRAMNTTTQAPASHRIGRSGHRHLIRHYLEMVAAMVVGMLVIGGAIRGAVAVAGLTYSTAAQPELSVLEMALDMSIGMVAWMRYRGHGWPATLEMVGVMIAPAVVLIPLSWVVDALDGDALMALEHLVMLPLMYAVMLRRRHEYGGHTHV
jgi:hypothetical protein